MTKLGIVELKEKILQLSSGDIGRSAAARLTDIIDEVEEAISKGVKIQVIIESLKESGLDISFNNFQATRQRIKRKNASIPKWRQKIKPASEKQSAAPTAAVPSKEPANTVPGPKKFHYDPNTPIEDLI